MKAPIFFAFMCILLALPSCDKDSYVRSEFIVADLPDYYFVLETSAGNLRVVYFHMESNELKGLRGGLGYHRGLENVALSGDTLRYTIDGGGTPTTYIHVIKKELEGDTGTGGVILAL